MTEGPYKDYWLDSKDGYPQAWSSSTCRWRFIDKGPHYYWQQVPTDKFVKVTAEEVAPKAFYLRAFGGGEPSADDESARFNILEW